MSIKFSQIGIGYWGVNILRNLNALDVLKSAYDTNKNIVVKYKENPAYNGINFGLDYTECLNDPEIQAVAIITPPNTHYNIARECLNAGKSVFIEKPMTLIPEESEELVKIAKEKNLVIGVGHIFLYSPEIIKLKEVITSDDFGVIKYIYTQRLNLGKVQNCGVILDLSAHDISILDYLLDDYCVETKVVAKSHVIPGVEDVAFISMNYSKGVFCNLHLSWLDPLKVRNLIVVGSKQMAVCDSIDKKVDIYNSSVDIEERSNISNKSYADHLLSYKYGDVVSKYIENTEPMKLELEDFISCVETGKMPIANGDVGLSVVKTMNAMKKALKNNSGWEKV